MLQLEVGGSETNKDLDNLISQTEYSLTVTPVYDEGPGPTMLAEAVTGMDGNFHEHNDIMATALTVMEITVIFPPSPL